MMVPTRHRSCILFSQAHSRIYLTTSCFWTNALVLSYSRVALVLLLCCVISLSIRLLVALRLTCSDLLFCLLPALVKPRLSAIQDDRTQKPFFEVQQHWKWILLMLLSKKKTKKKCFLLKLAAHYKYMLFQLNTSSAWKPVCVCLL